MRNRVRIGGTYGEIQTMILVWRASFPLEKGIAVPGETIHNGRLY